MDPVIRRKQPRSRDSEILAENLLNVLGLAENEGCSRTMGRGSELTVLNQLEFLRDFLRFPGRCFFLRRLLAA